MSLPRHICRQARHQLSSSPSEALWISDDALRHAWNRFTRTRSSSQKRNGSAIPGPLEARRRLARRRIMDVASVGRGGGGSPTPDIGSLFGAGNVKREGMEWEWKGPDEVQLSDPWTRPVPKPKPGLAALPSWLEDFVAMPVEEEQEAVARSEGRKEQELVIETVESNRSPRMLPDYLIGKLQQGLKTVKFDTDIHSKLVELDINLQSYPTCRKLIMESLLASKYYALAEIVLCDNQLNCPGAGLFIAYLQHCKTLHEPYPTSGRVLKAVKKGLTLGLIDAKEIGQIVQFLYSQVVNGKGKRWMQSTDGLLTFYWDMWRNIQSCPVFAGKDLGIETIDKWLGKIVELPFSGRSISLVSSMIRAIPPTKDADYQNLSPFLAKYVDNWQSLIPDPLVLRQSEIPGIADILSVMSSDVAWTHIFETLQLLVSRAWRKEGESLDQSVIGAWMTTVTDIEHIGQRFEFEDSAAELSFFLKFSDRPTRGVIRKTVDSRRLERGVGREISVMQPSHLNARFRLLRQYWAHHLGITLPNPPWTLHDITEAVLSRIQSHKDVSRRIDEARTIILSLHDFRVPYLWLWESVQTVWLSDPKTCPSPTHFAESLLPHGINLPIHDPEHQFHTLKTTQPLHALALLSYLPSPDNELHTHPQLTSYLIRHNVIPIHTLRRFSTPLSFRNALPYAHNLPPTDTKSSPAIALQHLNRLALEIAFSPYLNRREAFRQVWHVYLIAKRNGAPLTKELSRAIAHAGVGRWRVKGKGWGRPCDTQMATVARIVLEIEGREARDRLLFGCQ